MSAIEMHPPSLPTAVPVYVWVCVSVFGETCSCLEQTDMSSGPVGDVWERQQQYRAG